MTNTAHATTAPAPAESAEAVIEPIAVQLIDGTIWKMGDIPPGDTDKLTKVARIVRFRDGSVEVFSVTTSKVDVALQFSIPPHFIKYVLTVTSMANIAELIEDTVEMAEAEWYGEPEPEETDTPAATANGAPS